MLFLYISHALAKRVNTRVCLPFCPAWLVVCNWLGCQRAAHTESLPPCSVMASFGWWCFASFALLHPAFVLCCFFCALYSRRQQWQVVHLLRMMTMHRMTPLQLTAQHHRHHQRQQRQQLGQRHQWHCHCPRCHPSQLLLAMVQCPLTPGHAGCHQQQQQQQ